MKEYIKLNRLNESNSSDLVTKGIVSVINDVDDSLSYEDLAIAVANIIKEHYGTHLIESFIDTLSENLKHNEE